MSTARRSATDSLALFLATTVVTDQALAITESAVARTVALASLTRDVAVVDAAAHALEIDNNATLNNAIDVAHGGGGDALGINLDGAPLTGQAIVVVETAVARTTPMVQLTRDVAVVDAAAHAIAIDNNATLNNAIDIAHGGGGDALAVALDTSLVGQALVVTESAVARTTPMVELTRDAAVVDAAAHVIEIGNAATLNNALDITQDGGGDAIAVSLETSLTGQALVVTEDAVARTTSMVQLTRDVAVVNAAAHALGITNPGAGNSIDLDHSGENDAINIALTTNANSRAIVVTEDATGRGDRMVHLTRDAASDGTVIQISNNGEGRGLYISQGSAAGGQAALMTHLSGTDVTQLAILCSESAVARTVPMVQISRDVAVVDAAAHVIEIDNNATLNNAIDIAHGGGGDAIAIDIDGAPTTGQGLVITETTSVLRTTPMVELTRDASVVGAAAYVVEIDQNGTVANAIHVVQGGGGSAFAAHLDAAVGLPTAQALVVTETAVARTQPMIDLTRDAAASGKVLEITNAGSGLSIHVVSGLVQFDTAQAMGGGAAPTLGTIGGAGPAAAAQNEWIQINTQNGARFVAAWA